MIPLKHRMLRKRGRYMRVLTAAEIRGLESCAVESGVSMENAGAEVAAAVTEKMDVTGKKTVILCGKGNNGGDGFVAARLLAAEGAKVTVVLMQGAPASDLAKQAYDKMGRGIEIIMYRTAGGAVDAADVIIDAVFGFSFHGRLPSVMEPLLARAAENKKAFHISVDIPSGAVCDTGAVEGACFKADLTVTFTAMKPAGVVYPAPLCVRWASRRSTLRCCRVTRNPFCSATFARCSRSATRRGTRAHTGGF